MPWVLFMRTSQVRILFGNKMVWDSKKVLRGNSASPRLLTVRSQKHLHMYDLWIKHLHLLALTFSASLISAGQSDIRLLFVIFYHFSETLIPDYFLWFFTVFQKPGQFIISQTKLKLWSVTLSNCCFFSLALNYICTRESDGKGQENHVSLKTTSSEVNFCFLLAFRYQIARSAVVNIPN